MFYPFTNYKKITYDSDTGGSFETVYTLTAKSLVVFEAPYSGTNYNSPDSPTLIAEVGGRSTIIYLDERTGTGSSDMNGTGGTTVAPAGARIRWKADRTSGHPSENIIVHIFELPV